MKKFKFIDLFSGIGGFHQAMENLGGECVFASEIDSHCIETYYNNYKIDANHNVRGVAAEDIPVHDVLCAGFPCQAFSKAGYQKGMSDTRGTLFFEIERILKHHKTKYIILENVRNLVSHDQGNTWKTIHSHLKALGYRLTPVPIIISPHQFGIPQLRERVVILGIYDPENANKDLQITFDNLLGKDENSIYTVLDDGKVDDKYYISEKEEYVINAWDEFYKGIKETVIGFPIWAEYFKDKDAEEDFPEWKKEFIRKNKSLYQLNKKFIDSWLKKYNNLNDFTPTHRKMEWQAGNKINSLWEGVIQFRPSGIRVKTPTCFPALVAMVQIPIIGKYKRRLTVREAARLQSFPNSFKPDADDHQAYKQFGNAVNVMVIEQAARKLFDY
ncbi:MAG: DNA cytosine methyltransferase [Clostridia bacterium]|nr:DNA cytosine methyltransferase [Clostridia bacterium]